MFSPCHEVSLVYQLRKKTDANFKRSHYSSNYKVQRMFIKLFNKLMFETI